uniref:Uncharacterized protein n=1 Tax=Nelumbo nucifera TaxID=4432 RepID=A0A822ZM40_NELNU|nr:TPA_asm: hypothetical protein HUJ06_017051 [Nelumbo nucifera]
MHNSKLVKQFREFVLTQFDIRIKIFQSYNTKEYFEKDFVSYFGRFGVIH